MWSGSSGGCRRFQSNPADALSCERGVSAWHRCSVPYYRDLQRCVELKGISRGALILAVGWLAHGKPFATGEFPEELLGCLLCLRPEVISGGGHRCELCLPTANEHGSWAESQRVAEGSSVFLVRGAGRIIYAAPELIAHYIRRHNYAPPEEFTVALRARCARRSRDEVRIATHWYTYARAVWAFQDELEKLAIPFTHPSRDAEELIFGHLRAKSKFGRLQHPSDIEALLVHHAPSLTRAEAASAAAQLWEAWNRFLGHEDFASEWLQLSGPQRYA